MMGSTGSGANPSLRIQAACDENKHHRMLGIHLIVLDSRSTGCWRACAGVPLGVVAASPPPVLLTAFSALLSFYTFHLRSNTPSHFNWEAGCAIVTVPPSL